MSDPDKDKDEAASGRTAKDELFDAIDHLRNAAGILFEKASKDPTFDRATSEAEKVVTKIADSTEPLVNKIAEGTEPIARQVTGELAKLTRKLSDAMKESSERSQKRKKSKAGDEEE
jgi:hypothetical protein